jgi:hypothetical protein
MFLVFSQIGRWQEVGLVAVYFSPLSHGISHYAPL